MTNSLQIEQITRSLAYMLRHKPEEFDLELDRFGAAEVSEVVQALNERLGEPIEEEDLMDAVHSGDRLRYDIKDGRIRALYGHSIQVDPGESCKPPELLYVGLGSRDAERAERYGLRAGRRAFLHLARAHEDALETGRYQARSYTVVTVYALDAWEQGINFYDRGTLYLADPIPTEFLEVGEIHSDGTPPVRRGDRDRDRGSRGGRGRSRGRGERGSDERRGDRDRDRDRDRGRGRRGDRDREDEEPRRERAEAPAQREESTERGERSGRGGRGDRGDRGDRGPRRERAPRNEDRPRREEPRREEPRREEPRREEPRQSKPEAPAPAAFGAFGAGLAEEASARPKSETPKPAPAPEPAPEQQRAPEPAPAPEPPKPAGPSFGAGI